MPFSKAILTARSVSYKDAGLEAENGAGFVELMEVSPFSTASASAVSPICLLSCFLHSVWSSCQPSSASYLLLCTASGSALSHHLPPTLFSALRLYQLLVPSASYPVLCTASGAAVSHHLPPTLFSAQNLDQLLAPICLLSCSLHSIWISS
jgi:hypothetical protein